MNYGGRTPGWEAHLRGEEYRQPIPVEPIPMPSGFVIPASLVALVARERAIRRAVERDERLYLYSSLFAHRGKCDLLVDGLPLSGVVVDDVVFGLYRKQDPEWVTFKVTWEVGCPLESPAMQHCCFP